MDLISNLPAEIKDKILEKMPTRDAARTALLSTIWKDVWLRHGRLVFDSHFFKFVEKHEEKGIANAINDILSSRVGPVKRFTLYIDQELLQQSVLDEWCLFLSSNGVEELDIGIHGYPCHKLPHCIVSCSTIRQLRLAGFLIDCPVNARCMFPSVTSLVFRFVDFNGIVTTIPKLEDLNVYNCPGIGNFEISAPKLKSLSSFGHTYFATKNLATKNIRWFTLHLETIRALYLSATLFSVVDVPIEFPTAINLQIVKLYSLSFNSGKQVTLAMQLLQKSPKLRELVIYAKVLRQESYLDEKALGSRFLEDPEGCFINQDLYMLKTVWMYNFHGSKLEMLFLKWLLSKSPALEEVEVWEALGTSFKMPREELLSFPHASPKAQLFLHDMN